MPILKPDQNKNVGEERRISALQKLGSHLQIKAEKMRLLARAEEGLGDGDFNPYTTIHMSPEIVPEITAVEVSRQPVGEVKTKLPVSMARKRRLDKKSRQVPPPTVDIRQYKPGYTWNRGGRVKEIRIRCIARKFLHLWKRKVFGRVTPSQARNHYRLRILKKTFGAWHLVWWEMRKEWRLVVRAECHYRYVLWIKTIRAWRDFIVRQRIKNTKLALAEQHASCKLTHRCLDGWIVHTQCRRNKRKKQQEAEAHHNQKMLRLYWDKWLSQHDIVQHRQHMESVALQFWAYRIQAQHWLIWQERMSQRRASVVNQYRAIRHHNMSDVRRCFQAWMVYWARRRQKKQEKEYAILLYEKLLVQKTFHVWLDNYRYRQAVVQQQEYITQLSYTFQTRRVFTHWKHYIQQRHEKYEMIAEAEHHYTHKLMRVGLSAFRLCVVQKRIKLMHQELADQLRYKQLIRRAWTHWLARCDNNAELKIIPQTQKARKHYRMTILSKCFVQLYHYCKWRQHRQAQYAKADAHYYMQVMPQYMFRLKVFVQLMKNNRENMHNGIQFRRENVQARFFYMWVNQFEFSKENRMNERMAIIHCDDRALRSYFSTWKHKTTQALQEAENQEIACQHYHETLCRSHLQAWRQYIQHIKLSQRQDVQACKHYSHTKVKVCLHAWIKYTQDRKQKKYATLRARQHYRRVVCRKMVHMWLHYIDIQRSIYTRVQILYTRKCTQRLSELFCTWRANVSRQIQERQEMDRALHHHQLHILSKIFKTWHRYSAIHAYKKSETRQWVESARQHLNLKTTEVYFTKWKEYQFTHVAMRQNYDLAIHHHSNKVKHKVMLAWQQYKQESIRLKLLQKQSDWFHNIRLTARYFIAWKHAHTNAGIEREKSNLALWHWCLNLHRRVLIGWYSYTQHRKEKAARYHDAMERRRCRLLKLGVTQWLTVADDMSAMRKNFAAQQHSKSAYETYQIALRCGLHWKHWALKQREARGHTKPRVISHPVSNTTPRSAPGDFAGIKGGHSTYTTPREVISTRSTPREVTVSTITPRVDPVHQKSKPAELPAPIITSSPGRDKFPRGSGGVQHQLRARPRRPDFLVESLKRAGLFTLAAHQSMDKPLVTNQESATKDTKSQVQDLTGLHVEKLNLSNLTNRTEEGGVQSNRDMTSLPVSDRSDWNQSEPQSANTREPFQNYNENFSEPVQNMCPSGGMQTLQYKGHNSDFSKPNFLNSDNNVQKSNSKVLQLMTPGDFLSKKSDSNLSSNVRNVNTLENLSERSSAYTYDVNIHSECQSAASTPRVLCQNGEHNHPLSETYSFKVGEFNRGEVTPRSTISSTTPREQLSSLGFEPSLPVHTSTKDIEKEIVVIRNRLKSFDQKKKKLRTMQKQLKQLSDWLKDMEGQGQRSDDIDVLNARQEVMELSADVSSLKTSVEEDKKHCTVLVDRVKILMSQMST